jgi:hypothetical protein
VGEAMNAIALNSARSLLSNGYTNVSVTEIEVPA